MVKFLRTMYEMEIANRHVGMTFPTEDFLAYEDAIEISNEFCKVKVEFHGYPQNREPRDHELERVGVALSQFIQMYTREEDTVFVHFSQKSPWNGCGNVSFYSEVGKFIELEYKLFDSIPF